MVECREVNVNKVRIAAALGALAALAVTACAGSAHQAAASAHPAQSTATAVEMTDASGQSCTALDSLGYCPGDDPPPQVTDPSGQFCTALDSLGYCPGDDPSPMQQWCSGDGYSGYQAVQSDLNQLQTDASNSDLGSIMSDGSSLFGDAVTASKDLPPGTKTQKLDYGLYMGYLFVVGEKASTGDITDAVTALQKASQFRDTADSLTNQCSS